jgi:hypothetical protein
MSRVMSSPYGSKVENHIRIETGVGNGKENSDVML